MKKMIVRADDVGYTVPFNDGAFKAIDDGVVTSADLMLDCPGSIDAMIRLRERPWISVGWHSHFWGWPVLDPKEVPSMVNSDGRFKFRHDQKSKNTCEPLEIEKEMCAQLDRCQRILGHVPSYTWINSGSLFEDIRRKVCDRYGIIYNFGSKPNREGVLIKADPKYESCNIYMPNQPAGYYKVCYEDSYAIRSTYDPVKYYTEDYDSLCEHDVCLCAWHPGYLDELILSDSSLTEARVKDVAALTSPILKQWISDNHIILENTTDAIFGTDEYQNHFRK